MNRLPTEIYGEVRGCLIFCVYFRHTHYMAMTYPVHNRFISKMEGFSMVILQELS